MSKRFTDTGKWGDSWFSELELKEKLLWLYLLDTCDFAGVYKHSPKLTEFHTGIKLSVEMIEELFNDRCIIISKDLIFIPKFLKFQYPTGLGSKKPVILSIVKRLNELNLISIIKERFDNDYLMVKQSLLNGCITVKDKVKVKVKVKAKDKLIEEAFEKVWVDYERKGNRKTSLSRWMKLSKLNQDKIIKSIPLYKLEKPEQKFRKDLERFINDDIASDILDRQSNPEPNNQQQQPQQQEEYYTAKDGNKYKLMNGLLPAHLEEERKNRELDNAK